MEHSPASAIAAPSAPSGALIDRVRRNLDLLAARADASLKIPPDWAVRIGACPDAPSRHSTTPGALPFPPTTRRTLASEAPAGIVIEGFNPPPVALAAWRATRDGADAYRAPICILQADPIEFLVGLSQCEEPDFLRDPRCRFFVGADASSRFDAFLRDRLETALPRHIIRSPMVRTPLVPSPESILTGAHNAQQAEHNALRARIAISSSADAPARWAERFARARAHGSDPLRILIPTTRYSTYVRHAAADLAAAFGELGHTTRILEERTTDARLASVAYLREAAELRPDLIVAINYVRPQLRSALPDHVPMVCWVQDRMPHLFDRALGAAQGPLDFLAGHIHPSLYLDFGYPRDRALFRAVPASPRTFMSGPIDPARASELDCEVAYIGHQSETPAALHDRMAPAFGGVPGLSDAARDIYHTLTDLSVRSALTPAILDTITRDALRAGSIPLDNPRAVEIFDTSYTRALAERIHRHQTLAWASEICRDRGWRFHLYGNGWNLHPTLGAFARPPLDHLADLRAAYASARVSLHASLATNAHQRIAECALSGGLMARRGPSPDWQLIRKLAIRAALSAWGPGEPHTIGSKTGVRWIRNLAPDFDAPDWAKPRALRLCAAQGIERPEPNPDGTFTAEIFAKTPVIERDLPALPDIPLWTFPDYALPYADETSFQSKDELERTIERAATNSEWRAATVAAHAHVARTFWTTDRFASDLLGFIAGRLGAARITAEATL